MSGEEEGDADTFKRLESAAKSLKEATKLCRDLENISSVLARLLPKTSLLLL